MSCARLHRIFVGKDVHKFSSAHMTVFPDGRKERLHGHNFQVAVALNLTSITAQDFVDFGLVKQALALECAGWTERLLLAEKNEHFRVIRQTPDELEFTLCGKRYVVPADEVLLLPIDNVVVEALAMLFAENLARRLEKVFEGGAIAGLEVTITESSGQGGSYSLDFTRD